MSRLSVPADRGHHILVIPAYDLVIVHRVNTDSPENSVSAAEFGQFVKLMLQARPGA